MNALAYQHEINLAPKEELQLYEIARQMNEARLPDEFIVSAIKAALKYEGIADLLKLWSNETDPEEKSEIIAEIHELLDDCSTNTVEKFTLIKLNDLESIATDIRKFKDSLLLTVNEHGGIAKLSKLTNIPQPSLSRFFNSNAMPRRSTLLKIASALKLDAIKVSTPWER